MGKYFTESERYQLEGYYNKLKMKPKEIAILMNKHINTIYNELKRGKVKQLDTHLKAYYIYSADYAQTNYEYNASAKGRQLKIADDYSFAEFIERKVIKERYSLYSALVLANKNFNTSICLRTLYNYVYNGVFAVLTVSTLTYKRRKRKQIRQPKKIYQFGKQSIEERPKEVFLRDNFGHWEMDSVVSGCGCNQALLVLTERKTRYELIYRMKNKSCAEVWHKIENIANILNDDFDKVFKSITCDNGSEFSTNYDFKNERVKKFVQTNLYYCHPYRSCERGSNEKQNTFIRRFIPKGSHISNYTDDFILNVRNWLNTYPRKLFSGLSAINMIELEGVREILCLL